MCHPAEDQWLKPIVRSTKTSDAKVALVICYIGQLYDPPHVVFQAKGARELRRRNENCVNPRRSDDYVFPNRSNLRQSDMRVTLADARFVEKRETSRGFESGVDHE